MKYENMKFVILPCDTASHRGLQALRVGGVAYAMQQHDLGKKAKCMPTERLEKQFHPTLNSDWLFTVSCAGSQ